MNLQYYLDTNAVQSLGKRLEGIPINKGVYTSILTCMELLKRMENEDSYKRKRGPLLHLKNSGIQIDSLPAPFVIWESFRIRKEIPPIFDSFEAIVAVALESNSYEMFMLLLRKNNLAEAFDGLKLIFQKGNERFKAGLTQFNEGGGLATNRNIFKERWEGDDNRKKRLYEAIKYFAGKQVDSCNQPLVNLLMNYNHSIDLYMLTCYYYDEMKNYSRELAADNDGFDLQHLLYVRKGCKLVTDDRFFQKYVNETISGTSIGTEQFLKEINYNTNK